ncbi:MAG: 6-phospho-beta-glucosidase [Treponema sp.]|nr:6-phospho-beta-glucosidase [Treponema sp.]
MRELKAAIIGAGSTYTPELIEGIIERQGSLNFQTFYLLDINQEKLSVTGALAERMLKANGFKGRLVLTDSLDEAVAGADYIFAQIRVGGMEARIRDEKIPKKYGLLGQETTGIGGFMNALRTVPVMLHIARRIEELSSQGWLINFSNPSGIVADALLNHSGVKMVGLCNNFINMKARIAKTLGSEDFDYDYVGLNHLAWITSIRSGGRELLDEFWDMSGTNNEELYAAIRAIPVSYLNYFYFRDEQLKKNLAAEKTRGETIVGLEASLMEKYRDPNLSSKPEELSQRGGSLYSTAAVSVADAIENDKNEHHVVNVKNGKSLSFLEEDDVVEVKCLVNRQGAAPVPVPGPIHPSIKGLIQGVKAYEKLAAAAAISGSRAEALAALMVHPLIGDYPKARAALEDMLEANRDYLSPNFFS